MAEREFTSPVPRAAEVPFRMITATRKWERVALKWRALAEQRCAHFDDLYRSGRWKRYYTEEEFLAELRQTGGDRRALGARSRRCPRSARRLRGLPRSSSRRPPELSCRRCRHAAGDDGADAVPQANGSEQQILDWLGGQRDAMLALLQTLVNTDCGSYDKAGVDAVGAHIRNFLGDHGIADRSHARRKIRRRDHGDRRPGIAAVRQPADPADGPSRHRVPEGRADPAAVQDRRRPRLWAGRRRHEVRPGAELLRAGRHQEVRRRAGAGDGAVHRRRGDRLAVLAPGDRAARPRRARLLQLGAGPRPAAPR